LSGQEFVHLVFGYVRGCGDVNKSFIKGIYCECLIPERDGRSYITDRSEKKTLTSREPREENQMSETMPKRDVTGDCEGECKDRVNEGKRERQADLEKSGVKAPEDYPKAPGAEKRSNPPGDMGGHV
jgi:hypothetical protein